MDSTTTGSNTDLLVQKISKLIGHANGEEYFYQLLKAATQSFGMAIGRLYELLGENKDTLKLLVECFENNPKQLELAELNSSTVNYLLKRGKFTNNSGTQNKFSSDKLLSQIKAESCLSLVVTNNRDEPIGLLFFAGDKADNEIIEYSEALDLLHGRLSAELERFQLSRLLKKSEEDYLYLLEASKDFIWEIDKQGVFTYVNKSALQIYGYRPDEMLGGRYTDFMSRKASADFTENVAQVMEGYSINDWVANHVTKYGNLVQIKYSAKPKYNEYGDIVGVSGSSTDISESIRAQKTIKNNSELFSVILSRLPVIFFRVDKKGYIADIRGNGLRRMGVTDMEWIGKPGYGLFVGMDAMINSALSGQTVIFESKGRFNGEPWWFLTSMFFDSWTSFGAVGFAVDITEQKQSEDQLVHLLNDNRLLAQRLVEVQENERRALARELHDELGQTITAVKSLATAIKTKAGEDYSEIRSLGNSIIDLSGSLYEVVSNIMRRLRPDILDSLGFDAAINNCIEQSQLEMMGINCFVDFEGDLNSLSEVYKITLYRIVQECLTNITKYAMASNVWVMIKREQLEDNDRRMSNGEIYNNNGLYDYVIKRDILTIFIKDDGVGMDMEKDTKSTDVESKMGLRGIRERVTALNGEVSIESRPGKGVEINAVLDLNSNLVNEGADNYDEAEYEAR
ncbi:MAG: PAS domain S-box protein [Gammaproteobacteria bacterium]